MGLQKTCCGDDSRLKNVERVKKNSACYSIYDASEVLKTIAIRGEDFEAHSVATASTVAAVYYCQKMCTMNKYYIVVFEIKIKNRLIFCQNL